MGEVEELYNIALSITQNPKISVVIDNREDTAYTDYQKIVVTNQLAPKELWRYKRVMERLRDGQVIHEAGHIVITAPVKQACVKWMSRQGNQKLANIVHQCLTDKAVNHYCLSRYRWDYAFRLQLLGDVTNRAWVDSLKLEIEQARATAALTNPDEVELRMIQQRMIPISALKGLWNWDVEKDFKLNAEQEEFVNKVAKVFDDARFDKMTMSVVHRHQELYDLWEDRLYHHDSRNPEYGIPRGQGGIMELHSGKETKKAIKEMEKKFKEAEEKAKAEADKEHKGQGKERDTAFGTGDGLSIPTPEPDEEEYERLVQRNREHIERLLNLLKRLSKPKLVTDKFRQQGRFMNEILGKAFASSNVRTVRDVYASRSIKLEKAEACIGLIVDLSGSVSEVDAKDSLTVISEVCGRWLRDEDFGIMVFGSNYQKIKSYVEPYYTTRARIGGVQDMGGTELLAPLEELYKMMRKEPNSRTKILMIVSDFCVNRQEECKKLIKDIENDGIAVIGLGIDSCTVGYVKQYCKQARYIGNITELPEAVFDLYREAAFYSTLPFFMSFTRVEIF